MHLVNCSRDSYICAESLDAKLGSASLLAVVQNGQALLGEGRRQEVIRQLAPSCLRGGAPQLDRASLVSALGLIKVTAVLRQRACCLRWATFRVLYIRIAE